MQFELFRHHTRWPRPRWTEYFVTTEGSAHHQLLSGTARPQSPLTRVFRQEPAKSETPDCFRENDSGECAFSGKNPCPSRPASVSLWLPQYCRPQSNVQHSALMGHRTGAYIVPGQDSQEQQQGNRPPATSSGNGRWCALKHLWIGRGVMT